ncbi:uncharacterized protein LOC124274579 [Haliotis rubra]|uniref:uncharacterized protein LOC124274579 n=1 Tax=Haliotis rubra TaxID=36100 RepID=UPI001EE5CD52|nr:uncharacterized protein LOC124274579 [Haliotis rubra]
MKNSRQMQAVEDVFINGSLARSCEPNVLEESRNCIDAASHCNNNPFYYGVSSSQLVIDFICQNGEAFVAGKDCFGRAMNASMIRNCINPPSSVCVSTCVRNDVAMMPGCSEADSILMGRMVAYSLQGIPGQC